jgi:hypothetical protein
MEPTVFAVDAENGGIAKLNQLYPIVVGSWNECIVMQCNAIIRSKHEYYSAMKSKGVPFTAPFFSLKFVLGLVVGCEHSTVCLAI